MSAKAQDRILTLDELETLARAPSAENWHYLLRGLTDHFLVRPDDHVTLYGDAFSDIICRILDEVALEARVELSSRVAPLEAFPNRIVTRLAHDEAEVASPVLEQSPVLTDSDLIAIAGEVMPEHWLAITRRKALGPRLTDVLARFDSQEVIRSMAGNPGARFSNSTYRVVAEKAKKDTDLQEKLVERADMTPSIAVQLTPFLTEALKKRLAENGPQEEKGLLDSLSDLGSDRKKGEFENDPDQDGLEKDIAAVKAGSADMSQVAAKLADEGRMSGLCAFLCAIAELPEKTVKGALNNTNGMPISVICRGLGLSTDAFEAITHQRCEHLMLSQTDKTSQVERYSSLDPEDAKKTLGVLQSKQAGEAKTSAA